MIELHKQIKRVIAILFENVYCFAFQTYISFTVFALFMWRERNGRGRWARISGKESGGGQVDAVAAV